MAILNYTNSISANAATAPTVLGNGAEAVVVTPEVTLFIEKYSHTQSDSISGGDDIGFTIVFGNYSDFPYEAAQGADATLEDVITIAAPLTLTLEALALCDNYQLWVVAENGTALTAPYQLEEGAVLDIGTYTLQLRQLVDGAYTEVFDIPCNFIGVLSMMFSVSGCNGGGSTPACAANPLDNGDFELTPHETNNVVSLWDVAYNANGYAKTTAKAVLTNYDPMRGFTKTYEPITRNYFALLKTGNANVSPTTLTQTFTACAGDVIMGYSFFFTGETSQVCVNPDSARVELLDSNGRVVTRLFSAMASCQQSQFGTTDWTSWSYRIQNEGTYTLRAQVISADNNYQDSYLGLDAIRQHHEY